MCVDVDHARGFRARDGSPRVSSAVVLALVGAVLVANFVHLTHEHPHRPGQEMTCAVCATPLGQTAALPTLAPPSVGPDAVPVLASEAPAAARAPLSFSPKQSPPPSA